MAEKNCPSCGGSGVKNTSISKGDSNNLCSNCGGSGKVWDYFGGSDTCFPAGTRVRTPQGNVPIEQLSCRDYVIAVDQFGNNLARRVTRCNSYGSTPISRITFSDATCLLVTEHHTVKTRRGWIRVRDLQTGDGLTEALSGKPSAYRKISQIEKSVSVEPVYNIIVEGECTFIAEGIVAHSFTNLRRIRVTIHRLFYLLKLNGLQQRLKTT